MQQAVREITEMAERLETSGLKREQGDAVIQAIAKSIEKFAVTPEVLGQTIDRAFERADERERQRFEEQDKRIQRMFDERDKRFDQTDQRIDRLEKRMGERIDDLDKRFGERIEHMRQLSDERFEQRDKRSDERFEQRDKRSDERFEQRDKRSDERFNQLIELMSEKFALVHQDIQRTNERLDNHEKRFDGIDAKLGRITGWMVTLLVALVGTLAGVVARGMWP